MNDALPTGRWITDDRLLNQMGYHPATELTGPVHDTIRHNFTELAMWINQVLPEGTEKTNCLSDLRRSMMWANANVACNSDQFPYSPDAFSKVSWQR